MQKVNKANKEANRVYYEGFCEVDTQSPAKTKTAEEAVTFARVCVALNAAKAATVTERLGNGQPVQIARPSAVVMASSCRTLFSPITWFV